MSFGVLQQIDGRKIIFNLCRRRFDLIGVPDQIGGPTHAITSFRARPRAANPTAAPCFPNLMAIEGQTQAAGSYSCHRDRTNSSIAIFMDVATGIAKINPNTSPPAPAHKHRQQELTALMSAGWRCNHGVEIQLSMIYTIR